MSDFGRHARTADPITSHEAAESSNADLTSKTQMAIMAILRYSPSTDTEIIQTYNELAESGATVQASESGVRSRRAELVERGLVEATGEYRLTPSGRKSAVWRLVK